MEELYYTEAKTRINDYVKNVFPDLPLKIKANILDFVSVIINYEEEGVLIRPTILVTDDLDAILKSFENAYKLPLFFDDEPKYFNKRMKSLIPFCRSDYIVFVQVKGDSFTYGVCKLFNSIKEINLVDSVLSAKENEKLMKTQFFFMRPTSRFSLIFQNTFNDDLIVNFHLDVKRNFDYTEDLVEFAHASFSKLKTTKKKHNQIKVMFTNIFRNIINNINGAICVVVDKDYVDNGFFTDGVWLKKPIKFSDLFFQTKTYNEAKLVAISELFINMMNFDGITVIDNAGRILAYNVFIETDYKKVGNILGGARKRAAYTVINSRRKKIIGVYFQSHDGEIFFKTVKK